MIYGLMSVLRTNIGKKLMQQHKEGISNFHYYTHSKMVSGIRTN